MENITERQRASLERLHAADPGLRVEWDDLRGVPALVRGALTPAAEAAAPRATAERFLAAHGPLFGPDDPARWLKLLRARRDPEGWTHLEFQQTAPLGKAKSRALDVYGAKLAAHVMPDGALREVQSSCWREVVAPDRARLSAASVQAAAAKALAGLPGFAELRARTREARAGAFPFAQPPRLVIYPWQRGFRLAWTGYGYGAIERTGPEGRPTGPRIEFGELFVDATTGERFLFEPTLLLVENPDAGTGVGVTPLGAPALRSLRIVRVDATNTYRLRDTTHSRHIVTYDVDCVGYADSGAIATALVAETLLSTDADGDKHWSRLPANTTDVERAAGQQPEVDIHHFCREVYEWYDALAAPTGRAGWDDGQFAGAVPVDVPVRALAHAQDPVAGTCRALQGYFNFGPATVGGATRLIPFMAFSDGTPTQACAGVGDPAFDYTGGSKFAVAHEYHHGITGFSYSTSGNPGLGTTDWYLAVHEGMSDVFGGLCSEDWQPCRDLSPAGRVLRNLAYPRDPASWANRAMPCGLGKQNKDHYADLLAPGATIHAYDRGTVLAHGAYLMGAGGIHQRIGRLAGADLIPVQGLGRETTGGTSVLRAARIWYRAATYYFSTLGALTSHPGNDASIFRKIRDACESAAIQLYPSGAAGTPGSREHRTTVLAFFAVGLHPDSAAYGADVTFVRWARDWQLSRPYLGGMYSTCPTWDSLDLFINNGGASEWNALVNVVDPVTNAPTQYENTVYCRVRNVGDAQALNVQVQFFYAKLGTAPVNWLPVRDKNQVVQVLNVGNLGAGQSSFADAAQNAPPATAGRKWCIPPLAAGEVVNHFCLKAVVTANNDVNPHNNEVQSNIAYAPYQPAAGAGGGGFGLAFGTGNPGDEEIPLDLRVETTLPAGWRIQGLEKVKGVRLRGREERVIELGIAMPAGADGRLEPPFDGTATGRLFGQLSGPFTGGLTETRRDGARLTGRLAVAIDDVGSLVGEFAGRLDPRTAALRGRLVGHFQAAGEATTTRLTAGVEGVLRPWRRIEIGQVVRGEAVGGITVQIQAPLPPEAGAAALPPTDTKVGKDGKPPAAGARQPEPHERGRALDPTPAAD